MPWDRDTRSPPVSTAARAATNSKSLSDMAASASTSWRLNASPARFTVSTFCCDIARPVAPLMRPSAGYAMIAAGTRMEPVGEAAVGARGRRTKRR